MESDHLLRSVAELRSVYREPRNARDKEVDHLDVHCRDYIAHSPFAVLATTDGQGRVDTSPKGGPAGFVAVLDDHRLAIPDMSGNNRIDSLRNIVSCPNVSLIFLIPGIGETLRVVGDATVSTDPQILAQCRLGDLQPNVAIVVGVTTAYIHCAKALRRSGLWKPESWPDTTDMATPACMLRDHVRLTESAEAMQEYLEQDYEKTTWAVGGRPAG